MYATIKFTGQKVKSTIGEFDIFLSNNSNSVVPVSPKIDVVRITQIFIGL